MTYYAQRKSIVNGLPEAPNNRYGTKKAMERQFHLYCASACDDGNTNDTDSIEWGTLEGGAVERRIYVKEIQSELEPEEPEAE